MQDAGDLQAVSDQTGTLVLDRKGQVKSSTGELVGSSGDVAAEIIYSMLQVCFEFEYGGGSGVYERLRFAMDGLQDSAGVLDPAKNEELRRMIGMCTSWWCLVPEHCC